MLKNEISYRGAKGSTLCVPITTGRHYAYAKYTRKKNTKTKWIYKECSPAYPECAVCCWIATRTHEEMLLNVHL